jgi:hypothetical protein
MPGCVLRVSGSAFNVDAFLADSSFRPTAVYRKGETRGLDKSRGPSTTSGFNVVVSGDDDDIGRQCRDAVAFLQAYQSEIRLARSYPGVEFAVLDFSTTFRDVAVQSEHFSPELVAGAGALGLGIEMSLYPPYSA